jgi:hypothetical protein
MWRKGLLGLVFAGALMFTAAAADVFVSVAPPRVIVEHRGPRPSRRHVWVSGYHNWDGQRHVWVAGRWDVPPQGRSRWVAHRWEHRRGGYVLVEGHWQ